ncbi:hypothetical protein BC831DRAFT_442325 [Entophlyctis helioformis]|nr:hypothetical protein BC831DRAFT_442325 [Entophlyctis helioformis]
MHEQMLQAVRYVESAARAVSQGTHHDFKRQTDAPWEVRQWASGLERQAQQAWFEWLHSYLCRRLAIELDRSFTVYQTLARSAVQRQTGPGLEPIEQILSQCIAVRSSLERIVEDVVVSPDKRLYQLLRFRAESTAQIQYRASVAGSLAVDVSDALSTLVRSAVHAHPQDDTQDQQSFHDLNLHQSQTDDASQDGGAMHVDMEHPGTAAQSLHRIFGLVKQAGLAPIVEGAFIGVFYEIVQEHVEQQTRHEFDKTVADKLPAWLDKAVFCLSSLMHDQQPSPTADDPATNPSLSSNMLKAKLEFHAFRTLCNSRIRDAFEIVRDFPSSVPAIIDLQKALQQYNNSDELLRVLEQCIASRLLHCGVNTKDILEYYVSTAQFMAILKLPDGATETMLDPIRVYLRHREDALRQVVLRLIGESDDFETPHDLDGTLQSLTQVETDQLMSIFPGHELYAKDFQELLAAKLLQMTDFNIDSEVRSLEILKSRIGDHHLGLAQVMMHDVQDSRRISSNYEQQAMIEHRFLDALVVSRLFWPKDALSSQPQLKLPPILQEALAAYEKAYAATKATRKLKWHTFQGIVDLELECGDTRIRVGATPAQAAVVMLFESRDSIPIDSVIAESGLSKSQVVRVVDFWHSKGMLSIDGGHVINLPARDAQRASDAELQVSLDRRTGTDVTNETSVSLIDVHGHQPDHDHGHGHGHGHGMAAGDYEEEERRARFVEQQESTWPFVQSMLVNLGPQSLDSIHQKLGMFGVAVGETDLRMLLQWAAESGLADFEGGQYSAK